MQQKVKSVIRLICLNLYLTKFPVYPLSYSYEACDLPDLHWKHLFEILFKIS